MNRDILVDIPNLKIGISVTKRPFGTASIFKIWHVSKQKKRRNIASLSLTFMGLRIKIC